MKNKLTKKEIGIIIGCINSVYTDLDRKSNEFTRFYPDLKEIKKTINNKISELLNLKEKLINYKE